MFRIWGSTLKGVVIYEVTSIYIQVFKTSPASVWRKPKYCVSRARVGNFGGIGRTRLCMLQWADTYLIQTEYRLDAAVRIKQAQRNLPLRHTEWSALPTRTFSTRRQQWANCQRSAMEQNCFMSLASHKATKLKCRCAAQSRQMQALIVQAMIW